MESAKFKSNNCGKFADFKRVPTDATDANRTWRPNEPTPKKKQNQQNHLF